MPDPLGQSQKHTRVSRRALLSFAATAAALAAGHAPALAEQAAPAPGTERFLELSRKLTAEADLDPVTAGRILATLTAGGTTEREALSRLVTLSEAGGDAEALRASAETEGLLEMLTRVLTAWYTGTVTTAEGSTVVAYREALMYRPVADGLVVPTYCNKGPMWWQDSLPPGVSRRPVNTPEVL